MLTFPGEGSNSLPAVAHLPSGVGSSSSQASQATALLPPSEGSSNPHANSQAAGIPPNSPAIAHLPPSKGSNSPSVTAHLPLGEGSSSSQTIAHLPSREGSYTSQATALLTPSEGSSIPQATSSPQAGQFSNPTRSVRQGCRCPPRHPSLPRRIALSPGKTIPLPPPSRPPQGSSHEEPNPKWVINLSNKPLTPAQRSEGLFWLKDPTLWLPPRQPPNLEYITAIEAACTKLSQQDAEELRGDINRVLRSSHPPNLIN